MGRLHVGRCKKCNKNERCNFLIMSIRCKKCKIFPDYDYARAIPTHYGAKENWPVLQRKTGQFQPQNEDNYLTGLMAKVKS